MAAPTDAAGGVKKSSAPMWVTVPVWMPQQQQAGAAVAGAKAAGPHQSFPMAMPIYMPQHHHHQPQQEQQAGTVSAMDPSPSPASSLSSVSSSSASIGSSMEELAPHAAMKPLPPFGMPVFPPMPFMHPGFGPVTMVPPPQVDEQQEVPTHAPCA